MTSNNITFNFDTIRGMNSQYPWNGCITNANTLDPNTKYHMYPTGYCDLDGRRYVAIPINTVITESVIKQYNIM